MPTGNIIADFMKRYLYNKDTDEDIEAKVRAREMERLLRPALTNLAYPSERNFELRDMMIEGSPASMVYKRILELRGMLPPSEKTDTAIDSTFDVRLRRALEEEGLMSDVDRAELGMYDNEYDWAASTGEDSAMAVAQMKNREERIEGTERRLEVLQGVLSSVLGSLELSGGEDAKSR